MTEGWLSSDERHIKKAFWAIIPVLLLAHLGAHDLTRAHLGQGNESVAVFAVRSRQERGLSGKRPKWAEIIQVRDGP
jgi:hypothetical protein